MADNFIVESRMPDCEVVFYPYVNEVTYDASKQKSSIAPGSFDATNVFEMKAGADVISCNTSKAKGAVGTFEILLSSRVNYKSLIEPGCWVMVYMSDDAINFGGNCVNAPDSGLKMIGMVKSVRRREFVDPDSGTRIVRYSVSGQDFQCLLQAPIYLNAQLSQEQKTSGDQSFGYSDLLLGANLRVNVSPDVLLTKLLASFLGSNGFSASTASNFQANPAFANSRSSGVPIRVPSDLTQRVLGSDTTVQNSAFSAFLTLIFNQGLPGLAAFTNTVSGTVDVWNVMQSYQNPTLNELYTELIPVKVDSNVRLVPTIIFRPIPYNSPSVKSLLPSSFPFLCTTDAYGTFGAGERSNNKVISQGNISATYAHFYVSRQIREGDILGFDSGKSDKELHNFVLYTINVGLGIDQTQNQNILTTLSQGQGTKILTDQTSVTRHGLRPFISYTNYLLTDSDIKNANIILRDMWINAQFYESGTTSLRGRKEYIPVGTNIEFSDRGWIAHVEQVDCSFSVDEQTGVKRFRENLVFVRLQKSDGTYVDSVNHFDFFTGVQEQARVAPWDRGFSGVNV